MNDSQDAVIHKQDVEIVLARWLQWYITLTFPFLLVMLSVRLVMTPLFLQIVYNRPGFPEDFYGFTTQDRLAYAPGALEYLLNGEDITFLSNMRFPTGESLYNARELRHMRDVKTVTQYAYLVVIISSLLALFSGLILASRPKTLGHLRQGLMYGALFALALVASIVIVAIVNWNIFFTGFHQLFFEGGTWRFEYSDTLIRLFPEQFWFEAALTIGGLTVIGAGLTFLLAGRWHPKRDILPDSA